MRVSSRRGSCRVVGRGFCLVMVTLVCAALMSSACGPTLVAKDSLAELSNPVWPREPSSARIRWVGEIASPEDLDIRPGVLRRMWGWISGKQSPHLVRPHGVAVDPRGRLWVTDPGARRVHVFDIEKGVYEALPKGSREKAPSPIGITHDAQGIAYVSDSVLGVILRFSARGRMLESWGRGQLVRPTGVRFEPTRGLLWVVDTGAHRLLAFDRNGEVRHSVGGRGDKLGRFNFPTHVAVDGAGRIYVADTLNFRIQILSASGDPISAFGQAGDGPGALSRPKGVGIDGDGHIYVVDALFDNVQIFDARGRLLLYFGDPGAGPGQFWLPGGLCVSGGSRIYVADAYNRRVQVFEYIGG